MPSVPEESGCRRSRTPAEDAGRELPPRHSIHRHRADFTLRSHRGEAIAIETNLSYDTRDPLAVTLSFQRDGGQPAEWVLGRDLLVEGLVFPVGDGDVRIHPDDEDPGLVWIHLEVPAGRAELTGCCRQLAAFIGCTAAVVPFGREMEWMEIDASIARLFTEDCDDLPEP
ncbi:SsgA family sporulation/cell division regulator [Amycolatopsis coloradensis]|uniref:SsgA family sporulation/cell division regulator n=1 Tax=Amycolatopsis coloradensis TaxID=76021 RepID=A0ACD5BDW5_9PSEU